MRDGPRVLLTFVIEIPDQKLTADTMKIAVLLLLLQVAALCSEVKGSCNGKKTTITVTDVKLKRDVYSDYGYGYPDLYVKAWYGGKSLGKSGLKYGHKIRSLLGLLWQTRPLCEGLDQKLTADTMKIAVLLLLLQVVALCSEAKKSACDGKRTTITVTDVELNKKVYWDYSGKPDLYLKAWYYGRVLGKSPEKYGHKDQKLTADTMKIAVLLLLLQVVALCSGDEKPSCDGKKTTIIVTDVNLNKKVYWDYFGNPDLYMKDQKLTADTMKIAVLLLLLQVVALCTEVKGSCNGKKTTITVTDVKLKRDVYWDYSGKPDLYVKIIRCPHHRGSVWHGDYGSPPRIDPEVWPGSVRFAYRPHPYVFLMLPDTLPSPFMDFKDRRRDMCSTASAIFLWTR
ncbi:hypothetical protein WMY93_027187 [Mugilogobius chulae]|uniref:Uncharacterized protein n=1 Tax=Mugilogobius chulae TaxID=88201 RepID=A0AAW0MS78_9GOBI